MTGTTSNTAPLLLPSQVGDLVVRPFIEQSVATQVSTVVHTSGTTYRVPVVTADPVAAWVAEGAEITPSDLTVAEVVVTPAKLAGLSIITRELAEDTSPAAAEQVGQGLVRDLIRKADAAYFGNLSAPAPKGLAGTAGVSTVTAGASWTNVDPFAEAIAAAEQVNATVTAFAANPADALALAKLKRGTGSNEPLLGSDPTAPTKRTILGVPLLTSPGITAGTVWAIPIDRSQIVLRSDATVEADTSAFFTSDRVAIKATMRIGFAFPHPAALVKVSLTG